MIRMIEDGFCEVLL